MSDMLHVSDIMMLHHNVLLLDGYADCSEHVVPDDLEVVELSCAKVALSGLASGIRTKRKRPLLAMQAKEKTEIISSGSYIDSPQGTLAQQASHPPNMQLHSPAVCKISTPPSTSSPRAPFCSRMPAQTVTTRVVPGQVHPQGPQLPR